MNGLKILALNLRAVRRRKEDIWRGPGAATHRSIRLALRLRVDLSAKTISANSHGVRSAWTYNVHTQFTGFDSERQESASRGALVALTPIRAPFAYGLHTMHNRLQPETFRRDTPRETPLNQFTFGRLSNGCVGRKLGLSN